MRFNVEKIITKLYVKPKVNNRKIAKYLKKIGWKYEFFQQEKSDGVIEKGYSSKIKGKFKIYDFRIILHNEKLEFTIRNFFDHPGEIPDELFKSLFRLEMHFEQLIYNPESNSFDLRILYPSVRSSITFFQFYQCLFCLFEQAEEFYPNIRDAMVILNREKNGK